MKQYVVDAFTDQVFQGNQAAVCVMETWPNERLMMSIAMENNFSETAFTVKEADGVYRLRWFTPTSEVDLCGHATLATSFVLFGFYEANASGITFHTTSSGDLHIGRRGGLIEMDFPAYGLTEVPITGLMEEVMGARPREAYLDRDLLLVYDSESFVQNVTPDFTKLEQLDGMGVAVTAPGSTHDCVSRFFAPKIGIDEDPVTGSVHCMIAPYWGRRLGKDAVRCYQASKRGGEMVCELRGNRVAILGEAALFSTAELNL